MLFGLEIVLRDEPGEGDRVLERRPLVLELDEARMVLPDDRTVRWLLLGRNFLVFEVLETLCENFKAISTSAAGGNKAGSG